jgi:hypothetical protein
MTQSKLRAWVERHDDGFVAAFVGENAYARAPATRLCDSLDEAHMWVEVEAAAFGVPVKWVDQKAVR